MANKKLNRTSEHRKALLKNMLNSLIKYEQIKTTLPKAKFLKPQADKIITLGKKENLQTTKMLVSKLQDIKSANNVVLDDLRLNNEYITLKENNWFLIKIDISENERIARLKKKYAEYYDEHTECFNSITENDVIELDNSHFDMIITEQNYDEKLELLEDMIKKYMIEEKEIRANQRRGYIFDI